MKGSDEKTKKQNCKIVEIRILYLKRWFVFLFSFLRRRWSWLVNLENPVIFEYCVGFNTFKVSFFKLHVLICVLKFRFSAYPISFLLNLKDYKSLK